MSDQDNLRDRIAHLLHRHFELTAIGPVGCGHEYWSDEEHVAQAIIYEFGLTVETEPGHDPRECGCSSRAYPAESRVVGKWAKQ